MTPNSNKPPKDGPRILLLGHGGLGHALLEGLLSAPCQVVGVFRWSNKKSKKHFVDADERRFGKRVRAAGLLDIRCAGANSYEFMSLLETLKPDYLLIGSWGEILKPHVLASSQVQVVNCHPSLLPAHRGANPYVSVIRAGDTQTGVTFHLVDANIDTGPILMQTPVAVNPDDTGGDLRDRCARTARKMVAELISILSDPAGLTPMPQDETRRSYYPPMKMEDGQVQWHESPQAICNQVRGLQPWLDCYSFLENRFFFTFNQVSLETAPDAPPLPATIVAYRQGALWVGTQEAGTLLKFQSFRLYCFWFFLPVWVSKLVGCVLFQKGKAFTYP
jgi:methionyl-tRNA formyltransferase